IVGYLPLLGTLDAVGSLVLALSGPDGQLHFAGKVGTGFDDATRRALAKRLDAHRVDAPTAAGVPRFGGIVRWTEPRDVAEIESTTWAQGGQASPPSLRGLRPDKSPSECVREVAAEVPSPVSVPDAKPITAGAPPIIAGIRLSHADRVLDPTGITKRELADY